MPGSGSRFYRLEPQHEGHLLDDDAAHQVGQIRLIRGPGGNRAPVDDDPGRQPRARLRGETAPQHH